MNDSLPASAGTPTVTDLQVIPVAGHDSMLLNLSGAHSPYFTRNIVVLTDSETWAGNIHPAQALAQYRQKMGIGARLVVIGMVSNGFSIADPNDGGMLDVVGFDTATPSIISDFVRG